MNDMLAVQLVQRGCHFRTEGSYLGGRQRGALERLTQRLAFNEFHHDEIGATILTPVKNRNDIWM